MNNLLVNRLATLPHLSDIPRNELQWLTEHGNFEVHDEGTILVPKGKPAYYLYIVLSGNISISVDHGVGAKKVGEWLAGDVTGMLPYSRMTAPPGDNCAKVKSEVISVSVKLFRK